MKRTLLSGLSILLLAAPVLAQSTPPPLLNYEGVLLSGTGAPENGDRDMEFHFFDDLKPFPPENEILVDSHLFVNGLAVTVTNGMFNVHLGGGTLTDGTGPDPADGPYLELSRVFRDYAEVYLEVRVRVGAAGGGGAMETLLPRTRIVSSAYALNAHRLEGLSAANFLNTTAASQVKAGDLTVNNLTLNGSNFAFSSGTAMISTAGGLTVVSGDADTDDLLLSAGNSLLSDGGLGILGNGALELHSGDGSFSFVNEAAAIGNQTASLSPMGDLQLNGNLTVNGPYVNFGSSLMTKSAGLLTVAAGTVDSDDLFLSAGNNIADGGLALFGDGDFELTSGNGIFSFRNGATGIETAVLNGVGDLQLDGDITIDGNDLRFPPGGRMTSAAGALEIQGGSTFSDDLILKGGPASTYGFDPGGSRVTLFGNGEIELAPRNNIIRLHTPYGFLSYTTSLLLGNTGSITTTVNGSNADIVISPGGIGDLHLGDSSGDDVLIPGTLSVSGAKAFVQNHPYNHDLSIVYNSLEGDEAGTYTRGSARLIHGEARVSLGETFAWVTNPEIGLTAHVTPRGRPADLYVESVTPTELVVRSGDSTSDDAGFDYIVHGLRIGYEKSQVVRAKVMESTVPNDASYEKQHARNPELRRYSPMERFQKMETELRGAPVANFSESAKLRRAIGEHDLAVEQPSKAAVDPTSSGRDESTGLISQGVDGGAQERNRLVETGEPGNSRSRTGTLPMDDAGNVYAQSFRPVSAELATSVPVSETVELGDILVVDRDSPGMMRLGRMKADPAVVGIVSGEPGVLLGGGGHQPDRTGAVAAQDQSADDARANQPTRAEVPVAFSGIVLCKADAGHGAIEVGDLLTASPTPGHAMRADDPAAGTIVGKALEPLDSGTGLIKVLVMLR